MLVAGAWGEKHTAARDPEAVRRELYSGHTTLVSTKHVLWSVMKGRRVILRLRERCWGRSRRWIRVVRRRIVRTGRQVGGQAVEGAMRLWGLDFRGFPNLVRVRLRQQLCETSSDGRRVARKRPRRRRLMLRHGRRALAIVCRVEPPTLRRALAIAFSVAEAHLGRGRDATGGSCSWSLLVRDRSLSLAHAHFLKTGLNPTFTTAVHFTLIPLRPSFRRQFGRM